MPHMSTGDTRQISLSGKASVIVLNIASLAFQSGTAKNLSLMDSNERKKNELTLQSWKPIFLFLETYFQAIIFEEKNFELSYILSRKSFWPNSKTES